MTSKKKILFAEDDDNLGSMYTTRFEAEGYEVCWVQNGEDALIACLEFKPDLMITGILMPKISGFDVIDVLRNTPETKHLKILVCSALSQPNDILRAKVLGADEYLVKNDTKIADLMITVKNMLLPNFEGKFSNLLQM